MPSIPKEEDFAKKEFIPDPKHQAGVQSELLAKVRRQINLTVLSNKYISHRIIGIEKL